jgi:hypothetical protein
MEESSIIKTINDICQQYKAYKDGGISFIKHLAKQVLNTVDENKDEVINFFLNEIKTNINGFGEVALLTIVEMKASELGSAIKKIYDEEKSLKGEEWKHSIIEALMKLRYKVPKTLYSEYVSSYLRKHPDDAFFLLVQYCNVDPEEALPLLAGFLTKALVGRIEIRSFLESRIGFLFSYFADNPKDYLPDLIRQTAAKDKKAGLYLRNMLLDYFNSNMVKQYPSNLINAEREKLNKIEIQE